MFELHLFMPALDLWVLYDGFLTEKEAKEAYYAFLSVGVVSTLKEVN